MQKYIVSTYKRTDNGEEGVTYELLMREAAFRTFEGAENLALAMANYDGALREFAKVADGFAIAIHDGSCPVEVVEYDGRLFRWYGEDIAEQFFE